MRHVDRMWDVLAATARNRYGGVDWGQASAGSRQRRQECWLAVSVGSSDSLSVAASFLVLGGLK